MSRGAHLGKCRDFIGDYKVQITLTPNKWSMDERRFNACGEVDRIDDTLQKWPCATRFVDCKNWFKRLLTMADSNIKILSRTKKIVLNYSHSHVDDESDVANINISYHKFNRKITNPSYSTFDICFASGVVSTLNIITGFLNHFICFLLGCQTGNVLLLVAS